VGGGEGVEGGGDHEERQTRVEQDLAILEVSEQLFQVQAMDEFHGEKVVGADDAGLVDLRDVTVAELDDDAGLVVEAGDVFAGVGEVAAQRLHDTQAAGVADALFAEEDLAHSAPAKRGQKQEASEVAGKAFDDRHHHGPGLLHVRRRRRRRGRRRAVRETGSPGPQRTKQASGYGRSWSGLFCFSW